MLSGVRIECVQTGNCRCGGDVYGLRFDRHPWLSDLICESCHKKYGVRISHHSNREQEIERMVRRIAEELDANLDQTSAMLKEMNRELNELQKELGE